MPSNSFLTHGLAGGALNSAPASSLVGSNNNRQSRHKARADRRRGNWDILGVDTALLWAVDACLVETDDDPQCAVDPVSDLWP